MKPRRLSEQVADGLASAIARGDYPVGSRLPAERELADQLEVGRPTVREALLILELDGLVDIRTGSGVYVVDSRPKRARALEADIGMLELIEARCLFEGESAALAAKLATPAQVDAIRDALAAMEEEERLGIPGEEADRAFHVAIAEATQNAAIVYTVQTLWDARSGSTQAARTLQRVRDAGVRPRINEHQAVLDAIAAKNPEAARQAMRTHLIRVMDDLIEATKAEELEAMQARIEEQRRRYVGAR